MSSINKKGRYIDLETTGTITGPTIQNITQNITTITEQAQYRDLQVLNVSTSPVGPYDFNSIAAAVNSITDFNKLYVIKVGPGTYTEPLISLPINTSIVGANIVDVVIQPDGDHDVIRSNTNCEINSVTIKNAPVGRAGINIINCGEYSQVHKVSIFDCDIGVNLQASTIDSVVYLEYVDINGTYSKGVNVISQNNYLAFLNTENFYQFPNSNNSRLVNASGNYNINIKVGQFICANNTGIYMSGPGKISINGIEFDDADTAIYFEDGCQIILSDLVFNNCNIGILAGTPGVECDMKLSSFAFNNCTRNIQINNLDTTGSITGGYSEYNKTFINAVTPIVYKEKNKIVVEKTSGDFSTIADAIQKINIVLNITLTSGQTTITSLGLFRPTMSNYLIEGSGIPANTYIVYVNDNEANLSNAATTSSTVSATVIRATIDNQFTISIGIGTYLEPSLNIPEHTFIEGYSPTHSIIKPLNNTLAYLLKITNGSGINKIGFDGTNHQTAQPLVRCNGSMNFSRIDNCIFINADLALAFYDTESGYNDFSVLHNTFYNCKVSVLIDTPTNITNINFAACYMNECIDNGFLIKGANAKITINICELHGTNNGVAFETLNGADVICNSNILSNWKTAILASTPSNSGCKLEIYNPTILECDRHLQINDSNCTGTYFGNLSNSNAYINPLSVFETHSIFRELIVVAPIGADYSSVAEAVNSINPIIVCQSTNGQNNITSNGLFGPHLNNCKIISSNFPTGTVVTYVDNSNMLCSQNATGTFLGNITFVRATSTQQFIVNVTASQYTEPAFTIPPFVSLNGSGHTVTTLTPVASGVFITLDTDAIISNLSVLNATTAIDVKFNQTKLQSSTIKDCNFTNCTTNINIDSTNVVEIEVEDCNFYGAFTTGIAVNGTSHEVVLSLTNSNFNIETVGAKTLTATGELAELYVNDITSRGVSHTTFEIQNGVEAVITNIIIDNVDKALSVLNVGSAPQIKITNMVCDFSYINIAHPTTYGALSNSIVEKNKITSASSNFVFDYNDTVNNNRVIAGNLYVGADNANVTTVMPLLNSTSLGSLTGGAISLISGLQIQVASGSGYVLNNSNLKYVTWSQTNITLSANATHYIYANTTVTSATSMPDLTQNILLGRVRTATSTLEFIDSSAININKSDNQINDFLKNVFKTVYISGSVVTTSSRQVSVTSGKYAFGTSVFHPAGGSNITFKTYYHSGGNWTISSDTLVDNAQYDNGTNLTNLNLLAYTKHTLYLVGDATNETYMMVYGQNNYSSNNAATTAALPNPPSYFTDGVVAIASFVVQQGSNNITVISERPFPTNAASASTSVTNHGDLTGLTNDDHPQYLLTNGTRSLTGNLNLNSNNIINVSTVNNVTVETHASRHLPNGADALTTAAPSTITATTVSNSTGIANSFARSDHAHVLDTSSIDINTLGGSSLTVSKGGTGLSTLTAGNFLIGNGTSQVQVDKVAPVGVVIGDTDTQTLTNKTLNSTTNNILANAVRQTNVLRVNATTGNDTTGTAGGFPFATIQAAINVATSGQTVVVEPGSYTAIVTLSLGVNIIFMPGATLDITSTVSVVPFVCVGNNIVNNLVLNVSSSTSGLGFIAVRVNTATSNVTFNNCIVNITNTTSSSLSSSGFRIQNTGTNYFNNCIVNIQHPNSTSGSIYCMYSSTGTSTNIVQNGSYSITSNVVFAANAFNNITNSTFRVTNAFTNVPVVSSTTFGDIILSNVFDSVASVYRNNNNITLGLSTIVPTASTSQILTLPSTTTTIVGTTEQQTISNKNLTTTNVYFADPIDATKLLRFATSGNSTNVITNLNTSATSNQTLTIPNFATDTFVVVNGAQSLSNKTLNSDNNNNVWVGTGSGNIRNALNNTSIGHLALSNINNSGINGLNTAIGSLSLNNLITGTGNTALGSGTGSSITTGTNNTLLGKNTNVTNVNDTNAIAIGSDVTTLSNTAIIGNSSLTSILNSGNGVCDLGSLINKFANVHHTTSTLYGSNTNFGVALTATPGMTANYTLGLPDVDGLQGSVLAREPATNSSRWANCFVDIGTSSLSVNANTLTVVLNQTMKYLLIKIYCPGNTVSTQPLLRFNNDTSALYGASNSANGANAVVATNQTAMALKVASTQPFDATLNVRDVLNGRKLTNGIITGFSSTNTPQVTTHAGDYRGTADITSITLLVNTGNLLANTVISVFGSN